MRSSSVSNTVWSALLSEGSASCSTWMMWRCDGTGMVRSEMAWSRVDFPVPLRPTRPYLVPNTSFSVASDSNSCLPPYSCTLLIRMSMFEFARRLASGPDRMKNPSSSWVSRPPLASLRALSRASSAAAFLALAASSCCFLISRMGFFLGGPFRLMTESIEISFFSSPSAAAAALAARTRFRSSL